MTSTATVKHKDKAWYVVVNWGYFTETYGPYRYRWMARLVSWFNNNEH